MVKARRMVQRALAVIIGLPLLALGVILIPVPGPGLLVCFIALWILSFAFDAADKQLTVVRTKFKKIYLDAKARADKIEHWGDKSKK